MAQARMTLMKMTGHRHHHFEQHVVSALHPAFFSNDAVGWASLAPVIQSESHCGPG
jgi:hypothetical protein